MSNFSYLSTRPEYSLFANSAIEAEKVFSTSPAMCAVGCRKALELAVKWVYAADKTITMPYKDNPQSLCCTSRVSGSQWTAMCGACCPVL